MSADKGAPVTAEVVVEGGLLKVSAHKHALRERWVRILSDGSIAYWASQPTPGEESAPKGSGIVVAAEEWWPKPGSASAGLSNAERPLDVAASPHSPC